MMKLIAREPTPEMIAAVRRRPHHTRPDGWDGAHAKLFSAMWDAAPQVEGVPTDEQIVEACSGIFLTDHPRELYDIAVARAVLALAAPQPAQAQEQEKNARLHAFLDAAAGEGFVLVGVDAGDLYAEVFPERYAAALSHTNEGAQP